MGIYDESNKNDYFEDSAEVPRKVKEPKKPKLKPDDPRYWEEPEGEFDHLKPSPRTAIKLWLWVGVCAVVIGIIWGCYLRYFHPYEREVTQYGYIEQIAPHGNVMNSYEGVMLPYKNLMDTTRVYEGDFHFSTTNAELAAEIKKMQFANKPVRLTYDVYHTTVPWRGKSKIIVTGVDTVNERNILPPDRMPDYLK